MTDCILQLGLLAQDDASEWMNILFIVVVAVFWAVGGILKAAGNKSNKQGGRKASRPSASEPKRETWLQKLAKKAEEIQRAAEEQAREKPSGQQRPAAPSGPPEGRVTVRKRQDGESVLVYERSPSAKPVAASRQPQRKPRPRRRAPAKLSAAPVIAERPVPIPAIAPATKKPAAPKPDSKPLIDYEDTDALKRAILQYEILGKPVALRDPLERISVP